MFEKYVIKPYEFIEIPLPPCKQQLFLNKDGQVFNSNKQPIDIQYNDGIKTIFADMWNGYNTYDVRLIILITYGKLNLQPKYYHLVEPFHIDGDLSNLHPSNIGYRYKEPIECEQFKGHYYVPFFNAYVLSKDGILINWKTGRVIQSFTQHPPKHNIKNVTGGYTYFTIRSDVKTMGIGLHRLLALTFIPYPDNVDVLDVNHDDGIPSNNVLNNLEWATRLENIVHAYSNGLRTQNRIVYGKNTYSGEERVFYSIQEASRVTGCDSGLIYRRLNDEDQKISQNGWIFKSEYDMSWRQVTNPDVELRSLSSPTKILSKKCF